MKGFVCMWMKLKNLKKWYYMMIYCDVFGVKYLIKGILIDN